jgi:hypothetical protein
MELNKEKIIKVKFNDLVVSFTKIFDIGTE